MDHGVLEPASWALPLLGESVGHYGDSPCWVEVLVDCPGAQGLYVYRVPAELVVQPGDILSVPFGAQQVGAIAIQRLLAAPDTLEESTIRSVEAVVSRRFFPDAYWALLQQVATYYCTSLMQVVRVALPPGLLGRSQRRIRLVSAAPDATESSLAPAAQQLLDRLRNQKRGDYTWQYLQRQIPGAKRGLQELVQRGWVESYIEPPTHVRPKWQQVVTLIAYPSMPLSERQQEVVEVLKRRGGELNVPDLLQLCRTSTATLKRLQQDGWVLLQRREVLRTDATAALPPDLPQALTPAQAIAVAAIACAGYTQVLLHGVTGSGKTEVYLQAIAPVLQARKSVLVLVPEIGLTPQLTDRFRARFGDRVQVYHSALSEGERYDTWRQMLQGTPQIVIGTRSAVFSPLANLGLVVLDEEHDDSFKQSQPAPCYHARTIAQWRAQLADCPLVLGSATPSLESWTAIAVTPDSSHLYLSLPERIHARPLPPIEIVDMRQELAEGNRSMVSRSLHTALQSLAAEQGKQGLLFVPRRGHSTFVSCRSCGLVMGCPHCDISLTYHQAGEGGSESLRCHYCGYGRSHPPQCPSCGSPYLKYFGSGTQRVVQELERLFPHLRCLRFDSDTTRTKGAHRTLLSRFAQGEADLLVGTQMLTKGIDLPQVIVVGVVAADGLLHLPDYRAGERAFQVLTQVAGRSGRGDIPGQVIIQTYSPQHAVIRAVQRYDYAAFIAAELDQRTALIYPPVGRMALLRLSGMNPQQVQQTAANLAAFILPRLPAGVDLLGPAAATIERVARRYRWHILVKSADPGEQDWSYLTDLRSHCPPEVSLTLDIDPIDLL